MWWMQFVVTELVLLQSDGREVPWADFLREFTARYKANWSEVRTNIIQVVTGRWGSLLTLYSYILYGPRIRERLC